VGWSAIGAHPRSIRSSNCCTLICANVPVDLRPKHIPVWVHKHGWEAVDDSQRARSFLYTSLAATVATMFGKD
jgi:hypothetical protein